MKPTLNACQLRGRTVTFFIGMSVFLFASLFGCSKSTGALDESQKAAMREVREIASVTATLLNVYMDARVTDMLVYAASCNRLREALDDPQARSDANQILEAWLKISGAYEAILLLDKNGVCVVSAPAVLVNRNLSDDSAFKGALSAKLSISDAHKSDVLTSLNSQPTGWATQFAGWTVGIAVPVMAGNDCKGVLMSYLRWSRIVELTASIIVGETGYVYVLNGQRQVIIHPTARLYGMRLQDPEINLPELDQAIKRKVANQSYEFQNFVTGRTATKFVGFAYPKGYQNFPGLGWTIGAGTDESEVVGGHPLWRKVFR